MKLILILKTSWYLYHTDMLKWTYVSNTGAHVHISLVKACCPDNKYHPKDNKIGRQSADSVLSFVVCLWYNSLFLYTYVTTRNKCVSTLEFQLGWTFCNSCVLNFLRWRNLLRHQLGQYCWSWVGRACLNHITVVWAQNTFVCPGNELEALYNIKPDVINYLETVRQLS
jgi:hypothetical protein